MNNALVSNKISSGGENYFISYLCDDYKVKSLHVMLSKMKAYVKSYDGQTKWMYFLIEDDNLLNKYNTIWDKVSADIKNEFDREPIYNKHCLFYERGRQLFSLLIINQYVCLKCFTAIFIKLL